MCGCSFVGEGPDRDPERLSEVWSEARRLTPHEAAAIALSEGRPGAGLVVGERGALSGR